MVISLSYWTLPNAVKKTTEVSIAEEERFNADLFVLMRKDLISDDLYKKSRSTGGQADIKIYLWLQPKFAQRRHNLIYRQEVLLFPAIHLLFLWVQKNSWFRLTLLVCLRWYRLLKQKILVIGWEPKCVTKKYLQCDIWISHSFMHYKCSVFQPK